jgi:hypothetical protein
LPASSFPLSPFCTTLKAIGRGFLVRFHIGIWNSSLIYCHHNLLSSPSFLPLLPHPCTHCAYFTVLVFIINIWVNVQRGFSMCALLWSLYLLPPIFQHLSVLLSCILYLHIFLKVHLFFFMFLKLISFCFTKFYPCSHESTFCSAGTRHLNCLQFLARWGTTVFSSCTFHELLETLF